MRLILILFILFNITLSHAKTFSESVLIILSGESQLRLKNGKTHPTGFYLNELMIPVQMLIDYNYRLVFATPLGRTPHLDISSDNSKYFVNKIEHKRAKTLLKKLRINLEENASVVSFDEVLKMNLANFSGMFIPGGHAPMVDLIDNRNLGKLLKKFFSAHKVIASVCHGPVALLSSIDKGSEWIFKNYKMTVYSNKEESYTEKNKLKGNVPFYPEDALKQAGARLITSKSWKSHVVIDRNLITGQNPSSDTGVGKAFIKAMSEKKY